MKRLFPLILVAACAATPQVEWSDARAERVRAIAHSAVEEGIVGLSVGIALNGKVVFAEGFGHADLERTVTADGNTVYDIASVGKQFTAAAVLCLVQDGRLALDDRIREVLPETPDNFPDATVYELLHHTSGFDAATVDDMDPPPGADQPIRGAAVLDDPELTRGEVLFPPSVTWMYCNPGYLLLGRAVELASGESYPEFVRQRLFVPAEMQTATVFERAPKPDMADSIHRTEHGLEPMPPIHMSYYAGQGSVCSSVLDLLAWQDSMNEARFFSEASLATMLQPARVHGEFEDAAIPYGAGLRFGTLAGHRKRGHTGTFSGGSAALAHYPEDGLTIAVLSNTYGGVPHARSVEARIARWLFTGNEEPAEEVAQPLSAAQRARVVGLYRSGSGDYEVRPDGQDLVTWHDGRIVERLVHVGDLHFLDLEHLELRFRFLPDGDRAGWWVLERYGFISEVLRRVDGPHRD